MRRISLVLAFLVALASLPLVAEPLHHDRDQGSPRLRIVRIVRVIKAIFGLQTNSDAVTPPLPVAPPRP